FVVELYAVVGGEVWHWVFAWFALLTTVTSLCRRLRAAHSLHRRQGDREDRTRPVGAVGGADAAMHGLDEASGDGQAEAGARAHPIALLDAVELLEDALQIIDGNAATLVENLNADGARVAPAADADGGLGRSVLG